MARHVKYPIVYVPDAWKRLALAKHLATIGYEATASSIDKMDTEPFIYVDLDVNTETNRQLLCVSPEVAKKDIINYNLTMVNSPSHMISYLKALESRKESHK